MATARQAPTRSSSAEANASLLTMYMVDSNSYSTVPGVSGYGWVHIDQIGFFANASAGVKAAAAAGGYAPPAALGGLAPQVQVVNGRIVVNEQSLTVAAPRCTLLQSAAPLRAELLLRCRQLNITYEERRPRYPARAARAPDVTTRVSSRRRY